MQVDKRAGVAAATEETEVLCASPELLATRSVYRYGRATWTTHCKKKSAHAGRQECAHRPNAESRPLPTAAQTINIK